MNKKTVRDAAVSGKRVFIRCDFNVPLDETGKITDDSRIRAALPTVRWVLDRGGVAVLASHLGRPKGPDPSLSLKPVAQRLTELLGIGVALAPDSVGPEVERLCRDLQPGCALLLENVRFHKEETANDAKFAARLAALADLFVNDAFGTAHRAHASTEGIASHIPGVAGLLMEKEIEYLGNALADPKRPFVAVLGGAKVADKIQVLENLLPRVDSLLVGGAMMFTFFKALGYEIGRSLLDEDGVGLARDALGKFGGRVILAPDVIIAAELAETAPVEVVACDSIPTDAVGGDIGPRAQALFSERVRRAGTAVWTGPMGVFEMQNFSAGTRAVAEAMAECKGVTVVGGGDTAAAVAELGVAGRIAHVSTGGGSSLEFMAGKVLPGIAALQDR
ncbi:MAG: phosphoglycerate kinase [Armatimonadetes bacterium]|nr:phosphoglycerate kinase [Armatimonadota bacterium]